MDILTSEKRKKRPREASFWQNLKNNLPKGWNATRLESRATLGVPDVLFQDDKGQWHMVELKTTDSRGVQITPHQVAFNNKHAHGSCWVAVKCTKEGFEGYYLYRGDNVMDLRLDGLITEPTHFFPIDIHWPHFYKALAT